jgi:hypothetical protein
MRYRLRTLLIVLAIGPMVLAFAFYVIDRHRRETEIWKKIVVEDRKAPSPPASIPPGMIPTGGGTFTPLPSLPVEVP